MTTQQDQRLCRHILTEFIPHFYNWHEITSSLAKTHLTRTDITAPSPAPKKDGEICKYKRHAALPVIRTASAIRFFSEDQDAAQPILPAFHF